MASSPSSINTTAVTSLVAVTTDRGWDDVTDGTATDPGYYSAQYMEEFLSRKDDEFAVYVLPAMLYVGILMIIGIPGNVMVLVVYNRLRLRTTGTYRCFVQALAVYDLLSCLIGMPGEIVDMRRNYTFGTSFFCKIFRPVTVFCSLASGVTLVMVAVDRYRQSCRPFAWQITPKTAKTLIASCVVLGILSSAPGYFLYGSQTTLTGDLAINGSDCSTADTVRGTPFPMVFNGFHFLIFLVATTTMIVLYSIIAHKMLKQERFRKTGFGVTPGRRRGSRGKMSYSMNSPSSSSGDTSNRNASSTKIEECSEMVDATEQTQNDRCNDVEPNPGPVKPDEQLGSTEAENNDVSVETGNSFALNELKQSQTILKNKDSKNENPGKADTVKSNPENDNNNKKKKKQSTTTTTTTSSTETRRLTWMLFLVTLTFIVSFLPFLSMMVAKILEEASSPVNRGGWDLAWQNILMRSYFINSMANPVIYSLCSRTFRKECRRSVIKCLRRR